MPSSLPQDEIDQLKARMRQLDDEVQRRSAQKAKYRRQVNDIQAATSALPSETLSIIFELGRRSRKGVLTLGAVCTQWREVAWSNPKLWTVFHLSFTRQGALRWQIEAAKLWFQNTYRLSLSLQFRGEWGRQRMTDQEEEYNRLADDPGPEVAPDEEFLELVFGTHSHSLRRLTIDSLPELWCWYFVRCLLSGGFTELQALDVKSFPSMKGGKVSQELLPSLTHLAVRFPRAYISYNDQAFVHFPLEHLTSLDLHFIESHTVLTLLLRSPNLQKFACTRTEKKWEDPSLGQDRFVLLNLVDLEWDFGDDQGSMFLLTRVHLPSLRRLFWGYRWRSHERPTKRSVMKEFLSRSQNIKVFLSNSDDLWRNFTTIDPFSLLPEGLHELHFLDFEIARYNYKMVPILSRLTFPEKDESQSTVIFPCLKKLRIDRSSVEGLFYHGNIQKLWNMVRSRSRIASDQHEGLRISQLKILQFKAYDWEAWSLLTDIFNHFKEEIEEIEEWGVRIEAEMKNGEIWPWKNLVY